MTKFLSPKETPGSFLALCVSCWVVSCLSAVAPAGARKPRIWLPIGIHYIGSFGVIGASLYVPLQVHSICNFSHTCRIPPRLP